MYCPKWPQKEKTFSGFIIFVVLVEVVQKWPKISVMLFHLKMAFLVINFHINASSCACSVFNICIANYVFFLLQVELTVYVKRITNGNENNKCFICYIFPQK